MDSARDSFLDGTLDGTLDGALLLDLETDRHDPPRLLEIGAVVSGGEAGDETRRLHWKLRPDATAAEIGEALDRLDDFAAPCRWVLGHYVVRHDLPILRRLRPDLRLLALPAVDTLFLSPLAFPEIPYHSLVKDYRLEPEAVNDPVADAELAARLFVDECRALTAQESRTPGLLACYARCLAETLPGTADALAALGANTPMSADGAITFFAREAARAECCCRNLSVLTEDGAAPSPEMAYALAWLRVADTGSVLPPWVRAEFPPLPGLLDRLRRPDRLCTAQDVPDCPLCTAGLSARDELRRVFRFADFRPEPRAADGSSLQEAVTAAGLERRSHLAILATGAGKSVCYQLPALVHHRRRGELTLVISPLQALMRDQVEGLRRRTGGERAAALYGLLTPLERGKVLERVRWGEVALLYVAPEQLRNRSFLHLVAQREIAAWIYDEAHCLSKWGHDFRPDYLYAARFIRELAERQARPVPPVACFTATAKCDVVSEIAAHVRDTLGHQLELFQGDVERRELRFRVEPLPPQRKLPRIHELLAGQYGAPGGAQGGAGTSVVYFASRRGSEDGARFLQERGILAERFHAGLPMAEKRRVLDAFTAGSVPAVCATNAFGMGIDKDDVRLVVHAEMPGSLESYLQEAGRAGRDHRTADCVLLFDPADVERQFSLAAFSRLDGREMAEILRAVRRAVRRSPDGVARVTTGDLLRDDQLDAGLHPGDPVAGTKVRTAIAWLERAGFVQRAENRTRVFQGKLRVRSLAEAEERLRDLGLGDAERRRWRAVLRVLVAADPEQGLTADELAELPEAEFAGDDAGLQVLRTLAEMTSRGLLEEGLQLVVHLDPSRAPSALDRLARLERELMAVLQEEAPDAEDGDWQALSVRRLNQHLLDRLATGVKSGLEGSATAPSNPDLLRRVLDGLAALACDASAGAAAAGSVHRARVLDLRAASREQYRLRLMVPWAELAAAQARRAEEAAILLQALVIEAGGTATRGRVGVRLGLEDLVDALRRDLALGAERCRAEVAERALLHLHEQGVAHLQNGLAIFLQAMTLTLPAEAHGRRLARRHVEPLREHYAEREFQVHAVARYATLAAEGIEAGLRLVHDYFSRPKAEFVARHFPHDREVLERPTGADSWQRIARLGNDEQERIVTAPVDANLLVLAGPGSGKTRVVVHRCAWLLRVARVPARSVVVLCFNRNAALELRRRLYRLVQDDALGVTVTTFHGMALRLTGRSFATEAARETLKLDEVIRDAVTLLGRDPSGAEGDLLAQPDELRDRLLGGFRHILVDEYQDITDDQYELVRLLAGRATRMDRSGADSVPAPSILAVGDDDQTIYGWAGAEIAFLRRFREEYDAERHVLSRCYRSSAAILATTGDFVAGLAGRMKSEPLVVDEARASLPAGEPVRLTRVADPAEQAAAVVERLHELLRRDPDFEPRHAAVLARTHAALQPIRAALEAADLPVGWSAPRDALPPLHRIREIADFLDALADRRATDLTYEELLRLERDLDGARRAGPAAADTPWRGVLLQALSEWRAEAGEQAVGARAVASFVYDSLAEQRRAPTFGDGVALSTVHAAKGLEFRHVLIADGGWTVRPARLDEERRLFYVAMTRARDSLQVLAVDGSGHPHAVALQHVHDERRQGPLPFATELLNRQYEVLGLDAFYLSWPAAEQAFADEGLRRRTLDGIERLATGASVQLEDRGGALRVVADGVAVAQLSAQATTAWRPRLGDIEAARVLALVRRQRDDGEPEHRDSLVLDRWRVPLLEVVTRG